MAAEHTIKHNRLEPNYTNEVIKFCVNCGIIAVVKCIILSIMGSIFEQCSKA